MKCEKCGIDIVEGSLCENCKGVLVVNENVVSEVPQTYDPVADLMNEPVNGTVNLEKSEFENSIPMGDNTGIPEMPTNENVVFVMPQVEINQTPDAIEATLAVENTIPVESSVEVNPSAQNTENSATVKPEKQKMSAGTIIAIIISIVVLLVVGIFMYLRYLNVSKMFNTAKANVFVTEIHAYMDMSKIKFMTEVIKP